MNQTSYAWARLAWLLSNGVLRWRWLSDRCWHWKYSAFCRIHKPQLDYIDKDGTYRTVTGW
jgi:hypothetical protein